MDKFLDRYNLLKSNQDQKKLNRPITTKEIERFIIRVLSKKKKSPRSDVFNTELYQIFKKELISILLKISTT